MKIDEAKVLIREILPKNTQLDSYHYDFTTGTHIYS